MRCFIALAIPDAIADRIEDIQEGLRGARWSPPENLHLTLAFLGDQDRHTLADLDSLLIGVATKRFDLRLSGVGEFGGRDARAVFARVEESEPLRRLQSKVAAAARSVGLTLDGKRFTPHVTVGRWARGGVAPERLRAYIQANNLFSAGPFEVDRYTLYRSDLGRDGPIYDVLAEYPLSA